jgi:hypothetical protein
MTETQYFASVCVGRIEDAFASDLAIDLPAASAALLLLDECLVELGEDTSRVRRMRSLVDDIRDQALLDFTTAEA